MTIHLNGVLNIATTIAQPTIYKDAILVIQNHTPTPTADTQVQNILNTQILP